MFVCGTASCDVVAQPVAGASPPAFETYSAPPDQSSLPAPAAQLNTARYAHTATVLEDGTVLVAGGIGVGGVRLRSAERYDPVRNLWTALPEMREARSAHASTLLADGRVLVTGGVGEPQPGRGPVELASAELFDPVTATWREAAPMHGPRALHAAVLLGGGRVLVAGTPGVAATRTAAEIYDPAANAWTDASGGVIRRAGAAGVALPDGRVLVAGGRSASVQIYDPARGSGTEASPMALARTRPVLALDRARVVAAGGAEDPTVEVYDPASGTWARAGRLGQPSPASATPLPDGSVVFAGGDTAPLRDVLRYDAERASAAVVATLPAGRQAPTVSLLRSGDLLIVGGTTRPPDVPRPTVDRVRLPA